VSCERGGSIKNIRTMEVSRAGFEAKDGWRGREKGKGQWMSEKVRTCRARIKKGKKGRGGGGSEGVNSRQGESRFFLPAYQSTSRSASQQV
jgi:hypothetical protein